MTTSTVDQLKHQLQELRHSLPWAYAHGHGCTVGGAHPVYQAIREQDAHLVARIQEHTPEP